MSVNLGWPAWYDQCDKFTLILMTIISTTSIDSHNTAYVQLDFLALIY